MSKACFSLVKDTVAIAFATPKGRLRAPLKNILYPLNPRGLRYGARTSAYKRALTVEPPWMCVSMKKVFVDEMTREEFRKMMETAKVAVIPIGSTEQHGPHLPVKTDIACATYVVRNAAEALYPQVMVAPPVTIGVSPHHMCYPGTITLRHETFIDILVDVCRSLKHHGFQKVAIVNGHGGNEAPGYLAARRARDGLGLRMVFISYWSLIPREVSDAMLDTKIIPGHACEFETSLGYVLFPELIAKEIPHRLKPPFHLPGYVGDMNEQTADGYAGDPSIATREKGEKLIQAAVDGLKSLLTDFITKV